MIHRPTSACSRSVLCLQSVSLTLLVFFLLLSPAWGQVADRLTDGSDETEPGGDVDSEDVLSETGAPSTSPGQAPNQAIATQGLFMGHIYYIAPDRESMVVSAIEPQKPRKVFYLDKLTRVIEGRQRRPQTYLENGKKIAVWFFSENDIFVAEKVFLVEGEFHREEYIPVTALGVSEVETKPEGESAP